MVIRAVARLSIYLLAVHALITALTTVLWWTLDSGPLASDPKLVLTDRAAGPALRIYGDHADLDPADAARLTVDALARNGGFERSVLMVTIPTGSGWVDPDQLAAVEEWAGGDVATVAMRYSSAP